MANIHTDEEYEKLEQQYKNDLNKKIKLERELKIKSRQFNRLERTIKSMEKDMAEYSNLFNSQTDIAIHYIKIVNEIIILINNYYYEEKISKDVCTELMQAIHDKIQMIPNE